MDSIFPITILDQENLIVTFKYGKETHPITGREVDHIGIDLGGLKANHKAVYTPYDGKISSTIGDKKWGNVLEIEHDNGLKTIYKNLGDIIKSEGLVKQGEQIAVVGSSGYSTGPHLHFEVWKNGKHVDPAPYIFGWTIKKNKSGEYEKDKEIYKNSNILDDTYFIKYKNFQNFWNVVQKKNAREIIETCKKITNNKHDAIMCIMCAMQESSLLNLTEKDPNDRDSLGLFAQRPSMGWGTITQIKDITFATSSFLNGRTTNKGLLDIKNRYNQQKTRSIQQVQKSAFPNAYAKWESDATQFVNLFWGDGYYISGYVGETEIDLEDVVENVNIQDKLAPGIWQIVKVVIDPEVKNKQVNDMTVSMQQGSLYSFVEKICQKPFVEFFGDTYGDQYYFIIRKPPFTRQSFNSLPTIKIENNEVYNDSIKWNDDQVYSWYQLIPNGNYIGTNEIIFQYLKAVFFPEYAEIWGSRPLSITSNYITYLKESGNIIGQAALQDLQFIIDIHSYLPFTRKGTITIKGDRRIKRGMRIHYLPTDEYFYVEQVQQSFQSTNGVLDRTTVLTVSHGMATWNCNVEIEDEATPSYFNLINYGNNAYKQTPTHIRAVVKDFNDRIPKLIAYFNKDKDTFTEEDIDTSLDGDYQNESAGTHMLNTTNKECMLSRTLYNQNFENCKAIANFMLNNKHFKFKLKGNTDNDASNAYNIDLGMRRAKTVKAIILEEYKKILENSGYSIIQVEIEVSKASNRLLTVTEGETSPISDNSTNVGKLYNRNVQCDIISNYEEANSKEPEKSTLKNPDEGNWRVNRDVFTYFLRKQQFM